MCSRHFEDGRPTTENPYPTLFSYNNYKEHLNSRSDSAINKRACIINTRPTRCWWKPEWDRLWSQWGTFFNGVFNINTLNKKLVRICCVNFLYLCACARGVINFQCFVNSENIYLLLLTSISVDLLIRSIIHMSCMLVKFIL